MSEPNAQPGETPAGGQVPPTPAPQPPPPAPPAEEPFDKDRAMRTIETLRVEEKRAKQLERDLAAAQAKLKEIDDQQLSETERLTKKVADLEKQLVDREADARTLRLRSEIERQARKVGVVDEDAAYRLLDLDRVEYDADGAPANVEKLLKALVEAKPYLKAGEQPQPGRVPGTTRASAPSPEQSTAALRERMLASGRYAR